MKVAMEVLESGFKETEIGLIPEDWEVVKLGEVVKIIKGKKPKILSKSPSKNSLPYLTAEYFRHGVPKQFVDVEVEKELPICKKEDVILIWDGSAGQVFSGFEGVLASTMVKVIPIINNLNKFYLYYFLIKKSNYLNSQTTGSVIPHINKTVFFNLPLPLPPLEEQKAIADILSTVQNAIEKTEKVINATKQLKKSMMKHLFTYGAVAVDEIDKVKLKESKIGLIPEYWEVVRLGEVFDVRQGKQLSSKESKEGKTLKPFLRTSNILWNRIDISNLSQMPFSDKEFEALKICKGDILVCEGGDVGRTAVWEGQLEECAYQNHLHRLRPKENNIVNYFFSYWMEYAISLRGLYINIANKTTIPNLSSQRLKSFLIPLPPLDEQKKIDQILTTIDQKIQAEEKKKTALQNLFKTLLHHLMTGKIRVKKAKT
jgi:type I restriction enzyme S subunit